MHEVTELYSKHYRSNNVTGMNFKKCQPKTGLVGIGCYDHVYTKSIVLLLLYTYCMMSAVDNTGMLNV